MKRTSFGKKVKYELVFEAPSGSVSGWFSQDDTLRVRHPRIEILLKEIPHRNNVRRIQTISLLTVRSPGPMGNTFNALMNMSGRMYAFEKKPGAACMEE